MKSKVALIKGSDRRDNICRAMELIRDDLTQKMDGQEVIIKPLENRLMKDVKGFSGATIMGDGSVVLILDISTLA